MEENVTSVEILPDVAAQIREWIPALGGRALAVTDALITKDNVPTLPLVMVAPLRQEFEHFGRGRMTIDEQFMVEFWLDPAREKGAKGETPFWSYYEYNDLRDKLFNAFATYRGPANATFRFISMDVDANELATVLSFRMGARYDICEDSQWEGPAEITFDLCAPKSCRPFPVIEPEPVPPAPDPLDELFGDISGFYQMGPEWCYRDVAGTIPCTVDGDLIKCVKPRYGGLPWLTQATNSLCPVLKADGALWYALFDGMDDIIASVTTVTLGIESFLAAAIQRASQSSSAYVRLGTSALNRHALIGVGTGNRISGTLRVNGGAQYQVNSPGVAPVATRIVGSTLLTATQIDVTVDHGVPATLAAILDPPPAMSIAIQPLAADRIWGIAVHRAPTVSVADRQLIVNALAELQGRIL